MKTIPTQIPIFIEVCRKKNLSAAARKLGISAPAVSKAITRLEQEWEIKLFHRTSHSLSITAAGLELYDKLAPAVMDIHSAIASVHKETGELSGRLKINLPNTSLGVDTILPLIRDFSQQHPHISLDLHFNDSIVDLIANDFDIGIGTSINQDSRLIARQVSSANIGLYAAKEYIQKYGEPKHPHELNEHRCVPLRSVSTGKIRKIAFYDGEDRYSLALNGNIIVDSFLAAKDMICSGYGIAGIAEWMIEKELKSGSVVPILKDFWGDRIPVYIYFPSREYMPQRSRAFIDFISHALAKS